MPYGNARGGGRVAWASASGSAEGHGAVVRQTGKWKDMARVLCKNLLRRVVVGVESVQPSCIPTLHLGQVRLVNKGKRSRAKEAAVMPGPLCVIVVVWPWWLTAAWW